MWPFGKKRNRERVFAYPDDGKVIAPNRKECVANENWSPEWADEFESLQFALTGKTRFRHIEPVPGTELDKKPKYRVSTMKDNEWLSISRAERPLVEEMVVTANEQLRMAFSLADFPRFVVSVPRETVQSKCNPFWGNYFLIHAKPFTDTGRKSKYPFVIDVNNRGDGGHIECHVSLDGSGNVGRIESLLEVGGEWWVVTSKMVDSSLHVSRISMTTARGEMPTLYTIGK